ncbi:hypothetical protein HY492_01125 [Candidatus Woesearchaeota archaeon]|nr:hypothetical protein [Candidatus Woesearchaeota archaeon]
MPSHEDELREFLEQVGRPPDVDDFHQDDVEEFLVLGAEEERAADGTPRSELAQVVNINERRNQEVADRAPFRNINPISWSRGLLGGFATIPAPPTDTTAGNPVQLVYWSSLTDGEVCPVTVSASPLPLPASASASPRAVVRARWGVHNNFFQVDADVGLGVQFVINASSVIVSAYLDGGPNASFDIGASIGFYATAPTQPITRTRYLDSLAAATSVTVDRPDFATTVYGVMRSDAAAQILLEFLSLSGTLIGQQVVAANEYLVTPIPMPSNIRRVRVTNQGASAIQGAISFGLF